MTLIHEDLGQHPTAYWQHVLDSIQRQLETDRIVAEVDQILLDAEAWRRHCAPSDRPRRTTTQARTMTEIPTPIRYAALKYDVLKFTKFPFMHGWALATAMLSAPPVYHPPTTDKAT